MSFVPPPSKWQSEDVWDHESPVSKALVAHTDANGLAVAKAVPVETANDAWKHIRALVANDGRSVDLYDNLYQAGQDTIDPMPAGVSLISQLHCL